MQDSPLTGAVLVFVVRLFEVILSVIIFLNKLCQYVYVYIYICIIKEGEMATVCEKPVQVRSFMCSKPPESSFPFAHRVPIQTNDINMM